MASYMYSVAWFALMRRNVIYRKRNWLSSVRSVMNTVVFTSKCMYFVVCYAVSCMTFALQCAEDAIELFAMMMNNGNNSCP